MSDYNDYVTAVNKIFDYLAKMRVAWDSQDNISYIENIEEYKQVVVSNVNTFKTPAPVPVNDTEPVETETDVKDNSAGETAAPSIEGLASLPESSTEM